MEDLPCYHPSLGDYAALLRGGGGGNVLPAQHLAVGRGKRWPSGRRGGTHRTGPGGESQLGSAIAHLSRERETQVLQQLDEFSKQVVVVVENLHEMVRRFAAGATTELHAAAMEIDRLESKADVLKAEMLDRLSMGGLFSWPRRTCHAWSPPWTRSPTWRWAPPTASPCGHGSRPSRSRTTSWNWPGSTQAAARLCDAVLRPQSGPARRLRPLQAGRQTRERSRRRLQGILPDAPRYGHRLQDVLAANAIIDRLVHCRTATRTRSFCVRYSYIG